jgi:hypothetical protein
LSDHDAQLLIINDIQLQRQNCQIQTERKINKHTMNKFMIKLSYETWDSIFIMILIYLTIFIIHILGFFHKKLNKIKNNAWITPEIKTLHHHKRDLGFITTVVITLN